jgi:hypothetical protein
VKREFIVERQGRAFCLYAGLLDLAHQRGLKSIRTELVQIPTEENQRVAICTAVVVMEKEGVERIFTGIGDAAPNNVAPAMQTCLIRMAETRSKARALRDAVNIGVAAFEELGEEDACDGAPERGYQMSYGRAARPGGGAARTGVQRQPAPPPARTPGQATAPSAAGSRGGQPEEPHAMNGGITDSQVNAVRNLCRRVGVEADVLAAERFKVETLAALSQTQAGELIRALSAQTNGRHSPVAAA